MLSTIQFDANGRRQSLKLSTRAQIAIERRIGAGQHYLADFMAMAGNDRLLPVTRLVDYLAPMLEDGRGTDDETVYAIIDDVGYVEALNLVQRCITASMPTAPEEPAAPEADAGNGRPAKAA